MKVIRKYSDLEGLKQSLSQYPDIAQCIENEWFMLFDEQHEDGYSIKTFDLQSNVFMALLEQHDTELCISGLHGSLSGLWPEYVELMEIDDQQQLFRIGLMPDNDYFILFYVIKGTLEPETEAWLAEQAQL